MQKIAEETRLPVDIDAQPLVQAAAALRPVIRGYHEEIEREQRLREMLDRIADAEQRASEAEQRARETVNRIAELGPEAAPPETPAAELAEPEEGVAEAEEPKELEQPVAESEEPEEPVAQSAQPPAEPPPDFSSPNWVRPSSAAEDKINLNQATYDELRGLKLSVTQTGRVLAYRERVGGFKSLDELDSIIGFPHAVLIELKRKLTI
jgi:DNA uptake protein ComE-like DNA-binding protein